MFVETDGPINLAAPAKQTAQRHIGFNSVRIELNQIEKNLDRLVRLLVEKVIQAAEVVSRHMAAPAPLMAAGQKPSAARSQNQQKCQNNRFSHRAGQPGVFPCCFALWKVPPVVAAE